MFDWQSAFNIALLVAGAGVALYVRMVNERMNELRNDVKNINAAITLIHTGYATIPDLDKAVAAINVRITDVFVVLQRMEDKLDRIRDSK